MKSCAHIDARKIALAAGLSFLVQSLGVYKSFLWAQENMAALQQDVVQAQKKRGEISAKAEAVSLGLDDERVRTQLNTEADRFMEEVLKKGYQSEKGVSFKIERIPPKNFEPKKDKKSSFDPYRDSKKISEAESLYKVALSDGKVTLKEAVGIGLAASFEIQAAKKKIDVARSKLFEARRALFPTVAAVIVKNKGKAAATDAIPGGRYYKGESQKINVTQPIYYGGELTLTVKQAEANVRSSEKEYAKAKAEYVHAVRTAYYGVVKSEYNFHYQKGLYTEAESIHKRVVAERREKLVSEIDALNAESQYQQAFFQFENAKSDISSAALLLNQALEIPADWAVPVDLRLGFKEISPSLDEVADLALKNNPDLQMKELALESAQYGIEIYQAKKRPRVDLRGSFGYLGEVFKDTQQLATDNHDLDTEKEWFLGFTASMPLGPNSVEVSRVKHVYGPTVLALHGSEDQEDKLTFNLFDRLADITDEKSAEATYLQAKADYDKAKSDVLVQIREGFYGLQKALIQIDSSVARVRYQEKQNNLLRYLVSLQEQSVAALLEELAEQAQNRYAFIQAVTDYHLAASNLNLLTGDPDYFSTESES